MLFRSTVVTVAEVGPEHSRRSTGTIRARNAQVAAERACQQAAEHHAFIFCGRGAQKWRGSATATGVTDTTDTATWRYGR